MKKANLMILIVFLIALPFTLYVGMHISGRGYYIIATIIIIELMLPFFMRFEGKKPEARELVVVAVLCALAIAGRVVIPVPNFKVAFAIIIISGVALGPETGYMVGAITALVSNFFYGQGPYTPWQMMAYGAGGMLAGFIFMNKKIKKKSWLLAMVGFLIVVLWIGPLLDCSQVFFMMSEINKITFWAALTSGFPINISQGISTGLMLYFLGNTMLEKIERIKIKYGLIGE